MDELDDEISAFDAMRPDLETHKMGRWVVIHHRQLIGDYDSFEAAADDAVKKFGRGPYLIRQVGASSKITLPASVMYGQIHGSN